MCDKGSGFAIEMLQMGGLSHFRGETNGRDRSIHGGGDLCINFEIFFLEVDPLMTLQY